MTCTEGQAHPTPPQDAEDAMDVSPATSDAATHADIPTFCDIQQFQPHTGNEDNKWERQWFKDIDPVALNLLPDDAQCEVKVTRPFFDAKDILDQHLTSAYAIHSCPPDDCGSRDHVYKVPAKHLHALYASILRAHDECRATQPKHPQPVAVYLKTILTQGKSHQVNLKFSPRYPKISG